eukprot:s855_g10.t1
MGPGVDSPQAPARLSTGSVVWELELLGVRLHFRKLRGTPTVFFNPVRIELWARRWSRRRLDQHHSQPQGPWHLQWTKMGMNAGSTKVLAEHCSLDDPWHKESAALEVSAASLIDMCHHSLGCNTRHIKSALCEADDLELFHALWSELDVSGKYKPPGGMAFVDNRYKTEIDVELAASAFILRTLIATLNVEMVMWWANVYEDGSSGCDFHRDYPACFFCMKRLRTHDGRNLHRKQLSLPKVSASFGAARELVFRNEEVDTEMPYLQSNGDIMAFNAWVDEHFLHRVYPQKEASGPRISIILMGRTSIFEDQMDTLAIKRHHDLLQQSCRRIVSDALPVVLQREAKLWQRKEHLEAQLAEKRALRQRRREIAALPQQADLLGPLTA